MKKTTVLTGHHTGHHTMHRNRANTDFEPHKDQFLNDLAHKIGTGGGHAAAKHNHEESKVKEKKAAKK